MLPNHRPLVVAEQFGTLEALYPGRIDMGLGRSVGFTSGVRAALGADKKDADNFVQQLRDLLGYFAGASPTHRGVHALPAEGLRVPTFVLTHHPRAPVAMAGGTEFRFITDGIHAALAQATAAAGGRDVRLGGGVATIRQYLRAALIDELHLAVRPVLLGAGEHLLGGIDLRALGYECAESIAGERATHVFLRRRT